MMTWLNANKLAVNVKKQTTILHDNFRCSYKSTKVMFIRDHSISY